MYTMWYQWYVCISLLPIKANLVSCQGQNLLWGSTAWLSAPAVLRLLGWVQLGDLEGASLLLLPTQWHPWHCGSPRLSCGKGSRENRAWGDGKKGRSDAVASNQDVASEQQHLWNPSCSFTVAMGQPSRRKPHISQTSRDSSRTAWSCSGRIV